MRGVFKIYIYIYVYIYIYTESESPNEGACLRHMMNRNRQMRRRVWDMYWSRHMRGRV